MSSGRGKRGAGEADFAHSLADLMSGVAVTFLVLAAIFMVQASRATQLAREESRRSKLLAEEKRVDAQLFENIRLRNQQGALAIDGMRQELEGLDSVRVEYDPAVDPLLLTVVFHHDAVQFKSGSCALSSSQRDELRQVLRDIFPKICKKLEHGLQKSIVLEGHTDNNPPFGGDCPGVLVARACRSRSRHHLCKQETLKGNVQLSGSRANYIFFETLDALAELPELTACLEENFLAAGRGPVEPLDDQPWEVERTAAQDERNRRVVIKVRVTVPFEDAPATSPPGGP